MEWIRPTQHRDPQGEWGHNPNDATHDPKFAYDGNLKTMAMAWGITPEMNLDEYGDYWSGWLEMYPKRPIDGDRVRFNYHKSNHYGRTQIEVKRKLMDRWFLAFEGIPRIHTPNWHEIRLGMMTIEGIRIRFERPENLSGHIICFDVYGAEFYGELTDLPLIDPPLDTLPVKGSVEITGVKWGFKPVPSQNATIWRNLEHLGSNQGLVPIMVTWKNSTNEPMKGTVTAWLTHPCWNSQQLKCLQDNKKVVYPNESNAVIFELSVEGIALECQGEWSIGFALCGKDENDPCTNYIHKFTVGTPYIEPEPESTQDVVVWDFNTEGSYPKHLPDDFYGKVKLGDLTNIPDEVQGIYLWNGVEWIFWAKNAPGCKLIYLVGGLVCNYLVTTTGRCTWEIPLGRRIPPTNDGEKQNLRNGLENGFLADNWWTYTDDERREMALQITQWFSVEEFGEPKYVVNWHEKPNYLDASLGALEAHCSSESGLRYALIGGQHQPEDNLWYYTKQHGEYEWRKARQDKPFNLPVYVAFINWRKDGKGYGHWACALQVKKPYRLYNTILHSIDDFVYFQFGENDIKRGDAQMQSPGDTTINEIIGFGDYGHPKAGAQVGHWEY